MLPARTDHVRQASADDVMQLLLESGTRPKVARMVDAAVPCAVPIVQGCDVLHVSSVHPCDDVRILYRECMVLMRAGFDVRAAFFDVREREIGGVPLIDMGRRPRSRLLRAIVATWRMRSLVMRLKPRAVHLHDPELLPLALMLKRDGLVVFYDAHEDLPKQIFHKHWIPRLARGPLSRAAARWLPRAFARVDGLVVAARHIHDTSMLDHQRVVLRNMPIKRARHARATPSFQDRERAVAYVGAITPARDTLDIVRAALRTGATVYLAGRGEPAYLRQIQMLSADRVRYLGVLAPPDVPELLDRCRAGLAVLPSTPAYLEAVPSKLFDYVGAGLPCIISNFPNWHADLGGRLASYAVNPADPSALVRQLYRLLDDETAWRRAHETVCQLSGRYPTADEESTRLIDLYRSALDLS